MKPQIFKVILEGDDDINVEEGYIMALIVKGMAQQFSLDKLKKIEVEKAL